MSAAPEEAVELRWQQPDAMHIRTACKRYTVARVDLGACGDDYVAWRVNPLAELASVRVARNARDEERVAAIKAMQKRCQEDAIA